MFPFLEENIGRNSLTLVLAIIFWISDQRHRQQKQNKQVGLHQTKNPLHSKGTIRKIKGKPTTQWAKYFQIVLYVCLTYFTRHYIF